MIKLRIVLREEKFRSNSYDLERRGYMYYLFCQIGNRRGYVVSRFDVIERLAEMNYFPALVVEKEKIPLYKQSMDLQMGRNPKSTREVTLSYNVRVLNDIDSIGYYPVWVIQ